MDTETRQRISREQYRRIDTDPQLRRRLIEADYGRSLLWEVRRNGESVANLIDPEEVEDNWVSYQIVPLHPVSDYPFQPETAVFWLHPSVTFENRELNLIATHAFAAGDGPSHGRIRIYGLHFTFLQTAWEKLSMKWQSLMARIRD